MTTYVSVIAALVAMDYVRVPVALLAIAAVVGIACGKSSSSLGCGIASAVGAFFTLYVCAIILALMFLAPRL